LGPVTGRCSCGAVRFQLCGPRSGISFCHCSRCRRASGGQPLGHIIVAASSLVWDGIPRLARWTAPSGYGRVFCPICGSPAPDAIFDDRAYRVPVGLLDDVALVVTEHIYVDSEAPWDPDADEAPRYPGDGPARDDLPDLDP